MSPLSPDHPDLTPEDVERIRLSDPSRLSDAALVSIAKKPIYGWLNGTLPIDPDARSDGSHGRALAAINELWDRAIARSHVVEAASNANSWFENYPLFSPDDDVFVATVMELRCALEKVGGTASTSVSPREPDVPGTVRSGSGVDAVGSGPGSAPGSLLAYIFWSDRFAIDRHYPNGVGERLVELPSDQAADMAREILREFPPAPCRWPITACICGECGS